MLFRHRRVSLAAITTLPISSLSINGHTTAHRGGTVAERRRAAVDADDFQTGGPRPVVQFISVDGFGRVRTVG